MPNTRENFAAMNADLESSTGGAAGEPAVPCHPKKRRVWIAVKDHGLSS